MLEYQKLRSLNYTQKISYKNVHLLTAGRKKRKITIFRQNVY